MLTERWPYESEMRDPTMPVNVELMHDEIMALVSLIHNTYGWTRDERQHSTMPQTLRVALIAMSDALNHATRED